jgi:transposase
VRPYSLDLRERIVRAVDAGMSQGAVAATFGVGRATVQRYVARRRRGALAPRPSPGRAARIGPAQAAALRGQVEAAPDATLAEHCERWAAAHGVRVSVATMQRAIARLGWTRKKRRSTRPNRTRSSAPRGGRRSLASRRGSGSSWLRRGRTSGSPAPPPARPARAPRGGRAVGRVPRNHGRPTTLVVALTPRGLRAPLTQLGALNAVSFTAYVREVLGPRRRPGQVVVMDNLSVPKAAAVREAIEAARCTLRFLPPYSPDFAPIELAFAKRKAALRAAGARTHEAWRTAITAAVGQSTATDARGFFRHCGYSFAQRH